MSDQSRAENIAILAQGIQRDVARLIVSANLLEEWGCAVKISAVQTRTAVGQPLAEPYRWAIEVSVKPPARGIRDALQQAEAEAKAQTPAEPDKGATEAHGRFEERVTEGSES